MVAELSREWWVLPVTEPRIWGYLTVVPFWVRGRLEGVLSLFYSVKVREFSDEGKCSTHEQPK